MTRKFKFRAWHKELKQMVVFTFDDLSGDRNEGFLIFDADPKYVCISDFALTIMQYVGEDCKDSEGIEICEGDLLINKFSGRLYQVKYKYGSFFVEELHLYEKNNYLRTSDIHEFLPTKIIGNIQQNLELLKGG